MNEAMDRAEPYIGDGAEARSGGARDGILQAAVELIARDGFDGVRLASIAERAAVSSSLLHYHFASRERLLMDALAYSFSRAEARVERRARQAHRDRPAERLADLIDFGLPLTHDDVLECRLWAELKIRSTGSPELGRTLAELRRRIHDPIAAAVDAGRRCGEFGTCDPGDVATIALALLEGLTHQLITEKSELTVADARRLAGRQLALAVGHSGVLPFQPLPDPGIPRVDLETPRATPRRRRAPRAAGRP
ncbi:TetR family transcriptional regulator C-terminal domain-containing protein [Streptomyces sp. NPDC047981]|uniref:TetR/AcrR family transcriptional regulator n=1 Tax=Streptomyces sp. NPDC047981 TaxID=3154610 RepID=UPI0034250049